MKEEWVIDTAGTNIMDVMLHPDVDVYRTISNDILKHLCACMWLRRHGEEVELCSRRLTWRRSLQSECGFGTANVASSVLRFIGPISSDMPYSVTMARAIRVAC